MSFTLGEKPLVGEFKFVSQYDPAIDRETPDPDVDVEEGKARPKLCVAGYQRYLDTGDESHIPLKPGQSVTRFTLKTLNARQYQILNPLQARIHSVKEDDQQFLIPPVMFEFCRVGLCGWDLCTDKGGDVPFPTTYDKELGRVASDDVLDHLQAIHPDLIVDIGMAVHRRTYLGPLS